MTNQTFYVRGIGSSGSNDNLSLVMSDEQARELVAALAVSLAQAPQEGINNYLLVVSGVRRNGDCRPTSHDRVVDELPW